MQSITAILILLALSINSLAQVKEVETKPLIIGRSVEIQSVVLNENRRLNIYLPSSYSYDSTRHYPVIYLLDGGLDEDMLHITGLVQFGAMSWIGYWPESIVVGITNVDRRRDFTYPTTIEQDLIDFPTSGGSENFIKFLKNELLPFITQTYRTDSVTTLIGQSLGGLLATEIVLKQPLLFSNYLIVSPSLWWDNQSLLLHQVKQVDNGKIYIAVGKEGEIMENDARTLADKLKSHPDIHFQYFPEYSHGDVLHTAATKGLQWIFGFYKKE